jgi:transposase InsO family protein
MGRQHAACSRLQLRYRPDIDGVRAVAVSSVVIFPRRMRDELLNETLFFDLDDARAKIAAWVADYNLRRPHSSLKYLTPAAYAAYLTATAERLRNPDQLRRSSVAPPAPLGVLNLRDSNRC